MNKELASQAVEAMASVQAMNQDVPIDHPMSHAVRSLQLHSECALRDAFRIARELALHTKQMVNDYDEAVRSIKKSGAA